MKIMNRIRTIIAAQVVALALAGAAHAATVDLTSTQDVTISTPTDADTVQNPGGIFVTLSNYAPTVYSGLMQWDLSGLPSNAVVTDAYFTMYTLTDYSNGYHGVTSLVNPVAGQAGMNQLTMSYNVFNGSNPVGYNYLAVTSPTEALIIDYVKGSGPGARDSSHASAADLALINGRVALSGSDRYLMLKLDSTGANVANFQDHELSALTGAGFGPVLHLTYNVVPEPGTLVLSAFALAGLCIAGRIGRCRRAS